MSINEAELEGVEWVDLPLRRAVIAPDVLILRIIKASGGGPERRGNPSAAVLRWFVERGIHRIRLRLSSDGRFIALEGTEQTGSAIRQKEGSFAAMLAVPSDMPLGATIALSPFGRTLIGLYPHTEDPA